VFTVQLPSNGYIFWVRYSGFHPSCHSIVTVYYGWIVIVGVDETGLGSFLMAGFDISDVEHLISDTTVSVN
jgi:hypothetical protein